MGKSEAALERLYRERYIGFRNALTPVVGSRDVARDVVQEAFAQALSNVKSLRKSESLAPWVWQIAWRLAVQERNRRTDIALPDEHDFSVLDPEHDPALAAAVRSLPPKRRLVLFLRYYGDFTYSEIAEALDISEGTVAATLSHAHKALLTQLSMKEAPR